MLDAEKFLGSHISNDLHMEGQNESLRLTLPLNRRRVWGEAPQLEFPGQKAVTAYLFSGHSQPVRFATGADIYCNKSPFPSLRPAASFSQGSWCLARETPSSSSKDAREASSFPCGRNVPVMVG